LTPGSTSVLRAFQEPLSILRPGTGSRKNESAPITVVAIGGGKMRLWTNRDIEKARKVLAGVKPGRKKKS